jgi:pimeloyl-ACP methyl ester carboxylesterase
VISAEDSKTPDLTAYQLTFRAVGESTSRSASPCSRHKLFSNNEKLPRSRRVTSTALELDVRNLEAGRPLSNSTVDAFHVQRRSYPPFGESRMTDFTQAASLDPREQHYRIPGPIEGLSLFLRFLPATNGAKAENKLVLYVHGATFPSALSIAHRFDGKSWRDALNEAGFDVWGLDFYGFGYSDRYPEMHQAAADHQPLCIAQDAAQQVQAAARFILGHHNLDRLSLISHSWGAMPTCLFAASHPALVDRLVLFAPIARRSPRRYESPASFPAWRIVSPEDQWNRFIEDVPANEPPVFSSVYFAEWAKLYLDSDPESRSRNPSGVKTPLGPFSEIIKAWHGQVAYDPSKVKSPVAIIRGEWDGLVQDDDARWLFDSLSSAPTKRDIKIGRATHLMHLEVMRLALWRESIGFLQGEDVATIPS